MKSGFAKKTLFAAFSLCFAASNLQAHEALRESEENVIVDCQPLSKESLRRMEEQRREEAEALEALLSENPSELSGLIIPIKTHNLYALTSEPFTTTASISNPSLYHWIDQFPQSDIIKLEDGSEWRFDQSDIYVMRTWRPGDTLVISPKETWFFSSNYRFVLTNKDLGSSVDVNPYLGPISHGTLTSWVNGVDKNLGQVYLINGQGDRSVWEVYSADRYLFDEWAVNHTVMLGENNSWLWWFSSFNNVIINVNMNHYIRVRQISATPNYKKNQVANPA